MATGGSGGVEAKAKGAIAPIAIDPIGHTDAQVLNKEDAAAVVSDGGAEGVVADRTAVEGGVAAAALEDVVATTAIDVVGTRAKAKRLAPRSSIEDGAAAGDGDVGHRPEPRRRGLDGFAELNLAAQIHYGTSQKRSCSLAFH